MAIPENNNNITHNKYNQHTAPVTSPPSKHFLLFLSRF